MNEFYSRYIGRNDLSSKQDEFSSSAAHQRTWNSKMTGFVLLFLLSLFGSISGFAQTMLISPAGDGGFENGATLAANNWTAANSSADSWIAGTTPAVSAGAGCAFITSTANGAQTWTYSQVSTIQHMYYDVTIPPGESVVNLTFKWKAGGEGSGTSDWDNLKVFWGTSSAIALPVANVALGAAFQVSGTGAVSGMYKLSSATYNTSTIILTGTPGTTNRLVFSWKSDISDIANPPAALDEISLTSRAPLTPDAAPITFSATAVSQNATTLNWVDNSTNETFFRIYRSIDNAIFTQIGANIASTSSVGTGTAYSSIQTGLSAGTLYYYRIVSVVEAESPPLTGNQTTLNGATYYWVGTSTAATPSAFENLTNWNTEANGSGTAPSALATSDALIIDGDGSAATGGDVFVTVNAAATVGQFKVLSNTALTIQATTSTTRIITISGGPGEDFTVENGSTLNLNNATNAIAFAFLGAGNTGTIAGTYVASGAVANTINTTGGAGTVIKVIGSITSNLNSSSGCITGNAASLLFQNGSNYTHSNSTTINYIPNATWQANSTATLNGNTTGSTLNSASLSLGNLIVNTTQSTATLSAFTSTARTIQGNLTLNSSGTGRFRALTNGLLTINGDLVINGGIFEAGSTGGGVIVKGTTSVGSGATLDLGRAVLQNEGNMVNNGSVLSSETTTTNSVISFLGATIPQTFSGTGTFSGRISSLGVSNPTGLLLSTPVLTQRVNLFTGAVTGSGNITIGTGLALAGVVQIGTANNTNSGGSFDAAPVFNLGTGPGVLLYLGETTARTTGFEVPPTRSINTLILDNTNGLTIAGGTIEVTAGLTLTNGIVTATSANHIIHGSATLAGTLTGGSATSFISGPIVRTINDANVASNYILYPVGNAGIYSPISIAPTTTSAAKFRAEAFSTNTGTEDPSIIGLSSTRRFQAVPVSGTYNNINVRVSDAALVGTNIPVQAPTASGIYSAAFGSTATFAAGPPATITSTTPVASADYTGFISFANSNACSGIPAPGNTIASSNAICFGASVLLSLQNTTAGSGVIYQWQSSADGVTFTDIAGATASTFATTPTTATFYRSTVTCAVGPVTGTSTAVQVTFANSVASTTPASRCGLGTVTLAATASAGATISWYTSATGGAPLASGNSFETPSISGTTTYFAAAEVVSPIGGILGSGATTSTSAGGTFLPGFWGGAKTQYIIRASELIAAGVTAGNITNLGFEPTTSGQTYQGFVVQMGATAQTEATTTFLAGLTQVYRGTLADDGFTPVANAVNTLLFGTGLGSSAAFNWDGTSNIVVSISWSRVPGASTATSSGMKVDVAGFNATAWRQRDNFTPAAMLAETSAVNVGVNRPRFIINNAVICSSPRVAVTASVSVPPAFTLSATNTAICSGTSSTALTITAGAADYDTYVWAPSTGVSGNSASGWLFNPAATATYTLTASQSAGNLCAVTAVFDVVVNPIPAALAFTTTATEACLDAVVPITVSGGTLSDVTILSENFNGATNNWTTENASTGSSPAAIAWTLRNSPFNSFISNDASQFYLSDNDAGGSGSTANTALVSPSFSTVDFVSSNVSFWHYFRSAGTAKVEYSIDNGTIWNTLQTFTVNTGLINGFVQQNIALPAAALNQADVRIRFQYNTTGWEYYWAVDNVSVTGSQNTSVSWSPAANLFTDAAATVAYVANTNASTVYFKSSTAGVNNYTVTATTAATCFVTATTAITAVDCAIPYANIQFPGTATIATCNSQTYFARVFKAGVTESAGQGAGIQAWIGRNTTNTDPATWTEASWQLATFNVQSGNDDEYQATFGPTVAGTYYVASRFVFAPGAFVYGGFTPSGGGIWNGTTNISAVLIVEAVTAPTASAQSFCNTGTVANLVAVGTGIQWYADATGGTALAGTTALVTGNYFASQTIFGCESARTSVAVTVNVTAAPTASAQSFCNTGTVANLVAVGTGIQWYAAATGGSALAGTTVLVTGNYFASQTIAGCESARTSVAVTVNVTAAPTASVQSFCNTGTVANLVAVGTGIQWYAAATGGSALAGTTVLVTGNYFVSQTIAGCESARTSVAVTVNVTAAPTASAQSFCNTGTVANLVAVGTGIQWYAAATGGTALAGTTVLVTGNYFASQTIAGCESARTSVVVTINVTAAPTASAQSFCNTGTVANLVAVGTGIQWYAAATGGTALAGTTVLVTGNYFASQTIAGCESARTSVAVTINVTAAPTASAQSFCNTGTVANLVAVGTGIQWYAAATGGTALAGTTVLVTGNYFASQTIAGCESARTSVAVTINVTAAPTGTAIQNFTTGQTLANFTVVGQNIIWYSTATGSTVLPTTTVLVSGTIYYASQTVNGCESTTRLAVTAGIDLKTPEFEIRNLRYYPNPVQDVINVEYSEAIQGIQVYNMLGQLVYNRTMNDTKVSIEMTNMPAGNYIMQVSVNGIIKNVKVIKK
jgi:hypothetical protein